MTIRRKHAEMTKFDTAEDDGFQKMAAELARWTEEISESGGSGLPSPMNRISFCVLAGLI
jgi:hypothetical protein